MEYHVRPYPRQPNRGSAKLIKALEELEQALKEDPPNHKKLQAIRIAIYEDTRKCNDDLLIDLLRQLLGDLEKWEQKPWEGGTGKILGDLLKIKSDLKRL